MGSGDTFKLCNVGRKGSQQWGSMKRKTKWEVTGRVLQGEKFDSNFDLNFDLNFDSNFNFNFDLNFDLNFDSNFNFNFDLNFDLNFDMNFDMNFDSIFDSNFNLIGNFKKVLLIRSFCTCEVGIPQSIPQVWKRGI